jgi:branched-chain amino acid transport system substrate-binding protein
MNGESVDGIMSLGGIDPGNEKNAAYRKYHEEVVGQGPDYWGSVVTYSSLQMLQQAIERVGLDRELVSKELATGTFETAAGTIKLEDNQYRQIWWAGQWQKDKFVGVAPSNRAGASQVMLPKPAWK